MADHQYGPKQDGRFTLHQTQPRADKLTAKQRRLCMADPAFREALRSRVASSERFSAFLDGAASYIALERPCAHCGDFRKRTRDRSCYRCHLNRGRESFEFLRAGLRPSAKRSRDSHLDLLDRKRAEREGEHMARDFGTFVAKCWPTGRLEIEFTTGHREHDFSKLPEWEMVAAIRLYPALNDALAWAGWTVPHVPEV